MISAPGWTGASSRSRKPITRHMSSSMASPPLTRYRRVVITPHDPSDAWRTIAPYFQPPPEFAEKFGNYRSPLTFNDGTLVQSTDEWPRRRREILATWQELMGPWPTVLEKPKMEILSKERRDNFTQSRVRQEIAP